MYLEHYGLAEAPFRITPHTDFFFAGARRGATLDALLYAIAHDEGIVKISGEVGSGKTMLCRVLMERLPQSVVAVYLAHPSLSRDDILYALADELGIEVPEQSRSATVMRALQEHLVRLYAEGRQVVVLIDEAHAMPMETLEEIRLLSNLESNRHKLLQLALFGQPELDETLARTDMRQLHDRITHSFNLEPLVRGDINRYLDFRMRAAGYRGPGIFTPAAIRLITKASAGLTRRINILADKSLLAAFTAGAHQVGVREAKAAIKDSGFSSARTGGMASVAAAGWVWAAGGALVTLVLIGILKPLVQSVDAPRSAVPQTPLIPAANELSPVSRPLPAPTPTPTPTAMLDHLLADSQPWIESVDMNHWFIQLYSTADDHQPGLVEKFVADARQAGLDTGQLRVYYFNAGETRRYGVIYGDYTSRMEATRALDALPMELKRNLPYVRQVSWLKPGNNAQPGR